MIEQGDPRGELIALQCRGADAKIFVGANDVVENPAERVSELVAADWDAWLGELAGALVRQGSTFRDGMLSLVQVGSEAARPSIDWQRVAGHRELCAVDRVRPFKVKPDHYAAFLHGLVHDPHEVEVHMPNVIRSLRAKRDRWGVRTLEIGGYGWMTGATGEDRSSFARELKLVAGMARDLETIEVPGTYNSGDELFSVALQLPRMFPRFRVLRVELIHADGDALPRLKALEHVEIV